MPRFFVDELCPTVVITGDDAKHISRSLRMKAGDKLTLCDGKASECEGEIVSLSADAVTLRIGSTKPSVSEPSLSLSLFVALPKGDKAELVVQKCVELGASEIVFMLTSRCISRPDQKDAAKKIERLQKIANEAAGQSGRGILPIVRGVLPFEKAVKSLCESSNAFLLYEGECEPLRSKITEQTKSMTLLIGCEGGFSNEEVAFCRENFVAPVSLGKRILRCETAPIAATAAVMFYCGEMD